MSACHALLCCGFKSMYQHIPSAHALTQEQSPTTLTHGDETEPLCTDADVGPSHTQDMVGSLDDAFSGLSNAYAKLLMRLPCVVCYVRSSTCI